MQELWNKFGHTIVNILPPDPFADFINEVRDIPHLDWLNWFFPVGQILIILEAWLGAVLVFYGAQIVLRWVKVIQG